MQTYVFTCHSQDVNIYQHLIQFLKLVAKVHTIV